MIVNDLPYPPISGGRIRVYNLLRRVASRHEVSLAALLESPHDAEGVAHLQQFCARVETANIRQSSRLAKVPGLLRYALEGKPPELNLLYSEDLIIKIKQLFSKTDFDIVQIESVMGLYFDTLPLNRQFKSIVMFQNITSQQFNRFSNVEERWDRKLRTRLNAVTMGYWEPRYAERFDRCTVVSEIDRHLLKQSNPRLQVDVIPNGVDVGTYQPLPLPLENIHPSLLFIGHMGYQPCADAVLYFCREIFPIIRKAITKTEFWVVGRDPLPEVLELDGSGVHVTGRVEDVLPYYRQNPVCVVPLRAGGGTRLKILEAMALGRPVVSTTIGCEGLDVVDGEHLFIADTPEQFAEKTVRLLNDRQLYRNISTKARHLVETRYGWDNIAERLMDVYSEMISEPNLSNDTVRR